MTHRRHYVGINEGIDLRKFYDAMPEDKRRAFIDLLETRIKAAKQRMCTKIAGRCVTAASLKGWL